MKSIEYEQSIQLNQSNLIQKKLAIRTKNQ